MSRKVSDLKVPYDQVITIPFRNQTPSGMAVNVLETLTYQIRFDSIKLPIWLVYFHGTVYCYDNGAGGEYFHEHDPRFWAQWMITTGGPLLGDRTTYTMVLGNVNNLYVHAYCGFQYHWHQIPLMINSNILDIRSYSIFQNYVPVGNVVIYPEFMISLGITGDDDVQYQIDQLET